MANTGPVIPGSASNNVTVGSVAWSNPINSKVSDNIYATAALSGGAFTNYLQFSNFGFSIPSASTIQGILVEVESKKDAGADIRSLYARLVKGGAIQSTNRASSSSSSITNVDAYFPYGGSNDLWGGSWTSSDINNVGFGFVFSAQVQSGSGVVYVDSVRVTVYYSTIPTVNFSGTPTSGQRPLLVNFTDSSTESPTSWEWDFTNDGTIDSYLQNPSYTYNTPGVYSVLHRAINANGVGTLTKSSYITATIATYDLALTGTLTFGGDIIRQLIANRTLTGTLTFGGDIIMIRRGQTNALAKKTFLFKSYDENGVFQGVLNDVISEFTFTQEINTSSSSIELLLARNSDSRGQVVSPIQDSNGSNILDSNSRTILGNAQSLPKVGPGSDINYNNRIDVMAYYGSIEPILDSNGLEILDSNGETIDSVIGAPNGMRKFTGYISQINTQYGKDENTSITVTSYGADLKNYLVNDGAGSTTVAFNSYDPSNIIKASLDRFKLDAAANDELVYTDYTSSTVATTGSVASYTFKANNQQDMADKTLALAPAEWYYYIDLGTNYYHFHERAEDPEHVFYLGKHIESLSLRSGIENSASQFLGVGGGDPALYKYYNRTRAPYTRRGLIQYSDSRITLEDSLDIISEYELDAKNRVQYKTAINILDRSVDGDKGYPIDSITIGDTVGFRNFGNYVDDLIFQIVGLTYEADRVNLQLDTLSPTVSKRLADIRRNLDYQSSQYVPADPLV